MNTHVARALVRRLSLVAIVALAAACGASGSTPGPTPGPTILPGPTGGGTLSTGDLRLHLIDVLGPRWYCDPDSYPIGRDEQQSAIERFAQLVVEDRDLFDAVVARLGIDPAAQHPDAQKLVIWQLWKVAASLQLIPIGDGRYRFDYVAQPVGGAPLGMRTGGIINDKGDITIEEQIEATEPMCPICLARGTLIDTPNGPVAVEVLRAGDPIWTIDAAGRRVAGTVIALGSTTAPAEHHVIRLVLVDGRSVTASPGHPLADGRTFGSLAVGDSVDGSAVASLAWLSYGSGETFDLVASGATGIYFSDGVPLRSTLVPAGS